LQSEAVIASWRPGDDQRLLRLIDGADEFDRVARARVFLDSFPRSPLRPQVLLMYGDAAEDAAAKLSREAERRFERRELPTEGAPEFSYYLNYTGLDRYNRQGVIFTFDRAARKFHYNGVAWREIIQRYPNSPEAVEARKRLRKPANLTAQ
jgi:outer membrane protein assembly factor BamD (BamD/ComL family)